MVMTGYAANHCKYDVHFNRWRERFEERTGLSGDLLTCATDITEEEGIERGLLAIDDWIQSCVYTIFTALLAHVSEGGVVGWRFDALCLNHFAEVILETQCQYKFSCLLRIIDVNLPGLKGRLGGRQD